MVALAVVLLVPGKTLGKYLSSIEFNMTFGAGEVYDLDYEIWFLDADGNAIAEKTIKSVEDDLLPEGQKKVVDRNSLNSIFGEGRLLKIYNNSFYFTVTIDGRYTAEIFMYSRKDKDAAETGGQIPNSTVNEGYPLGTEPEYNGKLTPDTSAGPSKLNLTYTYRENNVHAHNRVIVKLTETKEVPKFDARAALSTDRAGTRGGCAKDGYQPDSAENWNQTNITPENGYAWGYRKTTAVEMLSENNDTGTYYHQWVFQTNTGDFLLDSLQINGYGIDIPFLPKISHNGSPVGRTEDDYLRTTVLPNGANVTVEFLKIFGSTQRVYRITVSNTYSNITVTAFNLMMYDMGAPEIVVYNLEGVSNDAVTMDGGNVYRQADLFIFDKGLTETGEITFKLSDYYESPEVSLKDINGNDLVTDMEARWDEERNCYVLDSILISSVKKLGLLRIVAKPIKFAIRYTSAIEATMTGYPAPEFDEAKKSYYWYDDNGGSYYTIENNVVIVVHNRRPMTVDGSLSFKCWVLDGEMVSVEQVFYIENLFRHGVRNDETGIYEITFTAAWEDWATASWQAAYMENCEEWSSMSWDEWYRECWEKWAPAAWRE